MNEPYALCEHIKDDNERCGSPAMTGAHFCYFHRRIHNPRFLPGKRGYRLSALENSHSLEVTVGHVLQALLDDSIDSKKAALLFRGLTLAYNAIRMRDYPNKRQVHTLPESLSHLVANGDTASTTAPAASDDSALNACHTERGRMPEAKDSDSAQITDSVNTFSATAAPGSLNLPVPASPEPRLSPTLLAQMRKVIRQGPSHPMFNQCAAALDRHISSEKKGA